MRKICGFLSVILCVALSAPVLAAEDADYTVGEFAVGLAEMITGRPDYDVEDAVRMLRGMGYEINDDLQGNLKEQELSDLLGHYGIELSTSDPGQAVSRDTANGLFRMLDAKGFGNTEAASDSIKCKGNKGDPSFNQFCADDADCPGGYCKIPPGQAKKISSPADP